MAELPDLIRQYAALLEEESRLKERKARIRVEVLAEMARHNIKDVNYAQGSAQRIARFKLLPRREEVLSLLGPEDLLDFAHFPAEKVKELLVPRYGRERLLPLFDIEKTETLVIRRPQGSPRESQPHFTDDE